MPWVPMTNWGKNVRLKPTKMRSAPTRPQRSLYILPDIFGHQ